MLAVSFPANICWSSTRLHRNNFLSSKTKRLQVVKTSSRCLEDVLEDEKLLRWRRLLDVLKTCLEDVLKTCLEDILKKCLEDIFKTCLEDVFKMSWRQAKCFLGISVSNKSKCISNKLYLTNLYLANLRRIQNPLIRTQQFRDSSNFKTQVAFLF